MNSPYRSGSASIIHLHREERGTVEQFSLSDTRLTQRHESARTTYRTSYKLTELSPEVTTLEGKAQPPKGMLAAGAFALGLAVVVQMSVLPEFVPLLGPFLGIVGGICLMLDLRLRMGKHSWTIVNRANGEAAVTILHRGCKLADLEAFEQALHQRIQDAHHAEPTPRQREQ